jgi:hypothetical protein
MIQSQTVVPVEFTSANRRLAGWHDQYRIMSHCHDSQFAIAWPDCQLFAQAHMAGAGHAMYVVPVPPYSVPGPAGYAIVDMDTEGAPSVRTTSIRTPYDTYPGALLTAAAIIAAEHIDSEE